LRRLHVYGIGLLASLTMAMPAQTFLAPVAAANAGAACPGYGSTTVPPAYIRVLRHKTGRVDRVPIKQYVLVVLGREWPSYLPQQAINAGAVAVKQYAWYHALLGGRMTRSGQCFDVTDGTGDQLYTPSRSRVNQDHYTAINETWGVRLTKSGSLFMTGYRTGAPGSCGSDATGWKLYARSATRCAYRGDGYLQILRIYYGPVSVVGDAGTASATADTSGSAAEKSPVSTAPPPTTTTTDSITADAGTTGGVGDDVSPAVPVVVPPPAVGPIGEIAFTTT
jgi:hypothetical protein